MVEIIALALLAAGCAGAFLTARVCVRMLGDARAAGERGECAGRTCRDGRGGRRERRAGDAEQERYEQGVANILAYGTREMLRRRGEAQ